MVKRRSPGGTAARILLPCALPAVALLGVATLAGCEGAVPDAGPEAVEVTGDFGQRPNVSFDPPLAVREPSVSVLIDGDGPELVDGAPVLVDWIAFDGSTGEVIAETFSEAPEIFAFTRESLGEDLYAAVSASGTNDRVLYLEPATSATGLPASRIVVVDVRPAQAQGELVQPAAGLPAVTLGPDGTPSIAIPGTPPPADRVEQLLVRGSGEQVREGAELVVQFLVVRWSDAGVEASTWGPGELPQRLDLETSIPGLAAGLLDHTVGSRVMLVVPPAEALGTDTLVFVVDILAVVAPQDEPTPPPSGDGGEPSDSPTPTAEPTGAD